MQPVPSDASDELMLPPANQDATFIQSLEGALQHSKATTSFYSGKRKAEQRVDVDSSGNERAKAVARETKDLTQRKARELQSKGVGPIHAPTVVTGEAAVSVLEPPVAKDASALPG